MQALPAGKDILVDSNSDNFAHYKGVTLTRDLCAEFEVWSPDTWSALLQQMVKFSMVAELKPTLRLLNRQPALWSVPGFLLAWEMVIVVPLASLLAPADEQGRELCRNQLKLLQHCPAAGELGLAKLARYPNVQLCSEHSVSCFLSTIKT